MVARGLHGFGAVVESVLEENLRRPTRAQTQTLVAESHRETLVARFYARNRVA